MKSEMQVTITKKRLAEWIETLNDEPCGFSMCRGPKKVEPMVTCGKCQVVHEMMQARDKK